MTSEYSQEIKTVLRWVIITRIIIDHMYFATYLGNLYSVFTWCRPEVLLPWMIVSALKNFILELIPLIVTTLLYLEGNFPTVLFIEFIIESFITFAPAVYYWCGIKSFFVELSHLKRRKLRRTNSISDTHNNVTYFDNNIVDNYDIKRKKFMSLINFDDLSFHSAFELEQEQEQFRQTKSLTMLSTMDSQVSVEPEELLTLPIIEDTSLTPAEKAMKILGLTEDDVNQTRVRLGKSILTNKFKPQQIEDRSTENQTTALLIYTENDPDTNKVILLQGQSKPEDVGQASLTFPKIIEMATTPSNDPTNDGNPPKRCTCQKTSDGTKNDDIIEDTTIKIVEDGSEDHEKNEEDFYGNKNVQSALSITEPSKKNINDQLRRFNPSVFWSVDFPRSKLYKVPILSDQSYDEDVENPETNPSSPLLNRSFQTPVNDDVDEEDMKLLATNSSSAQLNRSSQTQVNGNIDEEDVEFSDGTSGNLGRLNVELAETNDISLARQNQIYDNPKVSAIGITQENFRKVPQLCSLPKIENQSSMQMHKGQENSGNVRIFPNTVDVDIQTDFEENADKSIIEVAEADFFPNTSRISTSTQTNIIDSWKKTLINSRSPLEAVVDQDSSKTLTFSNTNPEEPLMNMSKIFPPGMTKIAKMKRRLENTKEREAREMKALRAYNRLTLLEDKREMELKKLNRAFNNRAGLQKLLRNPNWTNTATSDMREVPKPESNQRPEKQIVREEIHQVPKRQTRSRPEERTSKLSTFNLGLEALENSISLSFSSDNKKLSKLDQVNNTNQSSLNSQHDGRKQLSKYSKPMRNIDEVSSPSTARTEGLQTGRGLDRTRGTENMTHRKRSQEFDYDFSRFNQNTQHVVTAGTVLSSPDSLEPPRQNPLEIVEVHDRAQLQDKYGLASLKEAIKNTEWGFNGHNLHGAEMMQHENGVNSQENVLYDIIDNTDFTISLLQNAFASNPGNTERGFHLGPGSTKLYSVSNYLDDVVKEIMKTSRFRPNPDTFPAASTAEVDYGFSYLEEFEEILDVDKDVTSVSAENSDEETDSNLDAERNNDTRMHEVESVKNVQMIPTKPVEMCWNSYSRERINPRAHSQHSIVVTNLANEVTEEDQFDSQSYQDRLKLLCPRGRKSIVELLSEQDISYVEYWAKELKDLASSDRRNGFGFTKDFQHLTRLPGFCVIKMLVDFFRDFVAVSRSTMTSRMFLGTGMSSNPSSLGSEEFISGHYNELSNTSTGNELAAIPINFGNLQVNENDVSDALHTLIDRLMDSTERNDSPNYPIVGVNDNPLREDEFHFDAPANTYRFITEDPTAKLEAEVIRDTQKKQYDMDGVGSKSVPKEIDPQHRVSIACFHILGTAQGPMQTHEQEVLLPGKSGGPFRPDSTDDSFDSLYSAVFVKNSKTSNNVTSIGGESSFEEFPEDPNESQNPQ